jgi:hypothetical protein
MVTPPPLPAKRGPCAPTNSSLCTNVAVAVPALCRAALVKLRGSLSPYATTSTIECCAELGREPSTGESATSPCPQPSCARIGWQEGADPARLRRRNLQDYCIPDTPKVACGHARVGARRSQPILIYVALFRATRNGFKPSKQFRSYTAWE